MAGGVWTAYVLQERDLGISTNECSHRSKERKKKRQPVWLSTKYKRSICVYQFSDSDFKTRQQGFKEVRWLGCQEQELLQNWKSRSLTLETASWRSNFRVTLSRATQVRRSTRVLQSVRAAAQVRAVQLLQSPGSCPHASGTVVPRAWDQNIINGMFQLVWRCSESSGDMADFLTGEKDAWQRHHSSYSIAPCTTPFTSDVPLVPGKDEEMLSLPITLWVCSTNPLS